RERARAHRLQDRGDGGSQGSQDRGHSGHDDGAGVDAPAVAAERRRDACPGEGRRGGSLAARRLEGRRVRRRSHRAGRTAPQRHRRGRALGAGDRFLLRAVRDRRAPRRSGFPARRQSRARRHLQGRRDRSHLPAVARAAGPAGTAAQLDVLPEHTPRMNARTALTLIAVAITATGAFAQGPTLPPGLAPPSPPSATQQGNSATAAPKDVCSNCATIMTIQMTTERQDWTPLGTVAPGSVGIAGAGVSEGRTAYVIGSDLSNKGLVMLGAAGGAAYAKRPNSY